MHSRTDIYMDITNRTLYHEYVHSTGHKSRLDREGLKDVRYASETYIQEELLAEMGAPYLCAVGGTELMAKTLDNSAAYIQYWLSKLREDKRLIVHASSQAQRAVDWILGKRTANDEEETTGVPQFFWAQNRKS